MLHYVNVLNDRLKNLLARPLRNCLYLHNLLSVLPNNFITQLSIRLEL